MGKKYRICSVCHFNYDFCNHCNKDKDKPLWYFTFCSQNCHDIYEITSSFENGKIDADEAKLKLNNLNLSKLDNFGESYKKSINKIMSSVSVKENVVTEDVVAEERNEINLDDQVVEKENNDVTEEVVEEKVFRKSKNKRAKIDVEE